MDFETFLQQLPTLLRDGNNLFYLLYAVITTILTQIAKKIFVNKVKVDVLHKFDFATLLPFLFSTVFAVIDVLFVEKMPLSWQFAAQVVVGAVTVGALSTVIFKAISSLTGGSLKSLLKDDVFGVFYNQLLYFGNVRQQLMDKKITLKEFLSQVKLLVANARTIYDCDDTDVIKKDKLHRLLVGIIDNDSIAACVEVLHKSLLSVFNKVQTAESNNK